MIYTPLTKIALKLCYQAHKGQTDHSGIPYVFHPVHVAEAMKTEDETCTALLHDVLEDTSMRLEDLNSAGMPRQVLDALVSLKHDLAVPYMEYILTIRQNKLATTVKLADLEHNSDLSRLNTVTGYDLRRRMKYLIAASLLRPLKKEKETGRLYRRILLDQVGQNGLRMYYSEEGKACAGVFELPECPEKELFMTQHALELWNSAFISDGISLPEYYADRLGGVGAEMFVCELKRKGII